MDFTSVLDEKLEDIERPPLIPVGTYEVVVMKPPMIDTIGDGKFDVCDFLFKFVAAIEVDDDELAEYGDVTNAVITRRFFFDKDDATKFKTTKFQLRNFISEHLGVDSGLDMKQALAESVNQSCKLVVGWKPRKDDPKMMDAVVAKTLPLD